ncbi:MAG: hypothetical protein ABEJ83_04620 [Candidatus Nanohaloarchaea archaeon]
MPEFELSSEDIGTFYATEKAKLPSIKCPECDAANPLSKLVSEKECENCKTGITVKIETEEN